MRAEPSTWTKRRVNPKMVRCTPSKKHILGSGYQMACGRFPQETPRCNVSIWEPKSLQNIKPSLLHTPRNRFERPFGSLSIHLQYTILLHHECHPWRTRKECSAPGSLSRKKTRPRWREAAPPCAADRHLSEGSAFSRARHCSLGWGVMMSAAGGWHVTGGRNFWGNRATCHMK